MANLNAWQKIDRVLPGRPFGDGRDGEYTSTTIPTLTTRSCSGTAASAAMTLGSAGFVDGDVVLIHQSRGTGVGQWEINKIVSGGGTTSITLEEDLHYTYTDSGASQAQIIKIPMYSGVTVASGTWTLTAWAGDTDGIFPLAVLGGFSHLGTITLTAKGYVGGTDPGSGNTEGVQAEGTAGASAGKTTAANGNGGGGGWNAGGATSGGQAGDVVPGSGGHGTVGNYGSDQVTYGAPGAESGSADLITATFGGGGGSGGTNGSGGSRGDGLGGAGGGLMFLFAKTVHAITLTANGGAGTTTANNNASCGSGGAGGGVLIACETAALGSNLITATEGAGGTGGGVNGVAGAIGRIAVHHSAAVSGTTSPTFTDVTDSSLVVTGGAQIF